MLGKGAYVMSAYYDTAFYALNSKRIPTLLNTEIQKSEIHPWKNEYSNHF